MGLILQSNEAYFKSVAWQYFPDFECKYPVDKTGRRVHRWKLFGLIKIYRTRELPDHEKTFMQKYGTYVWSAIILLPAHIVKILQAPPL